MSKIPVITLTDLYHPHQDSDDNLDLLLAFGLEEIELLGVVLDCHQPFREPVAPVQGLEGLWADPNGPRDPGFVPVYQLNYIFDRTVPCAVAPFSRMRSPQDAMRDAPRFQQAGIELLLRLLREAKEPVHLLVQGSARPLAVALNRDPALLREKVARAHLCMGATSPAFYEWNIALDPQAAVRVLSSDLPIALYPCAVDEGPFTLGRFNTYWKLANMAWAARMQAPLKRYLDFVYSRATRMDFLRAMDHDAAPGTAEARYAEAQHMWTTAAWMEISGRRLYPTPEGYRLLHPGDHQGPALPHRLKPGRLELRPDGRFTPREVEGSSRLLLYDRGDPYLNGAALNEAFPALYLSLKPPHSANAQQPSGAVFLAAAAQTIPKIPHLLLDTDLNTDCGDAGALALLHALADLNEVKILGIGVSVSNPDAISALSAINSYYGRPGLPIGQYQGQPPLELHDGHAFVRALRAMNPTPLPDPLPDTTELYRRVLAQEVDGSVTVVAIGFHNTLQRLLESGPDAYSPLGGLDLVRAKVRRLVVMGGQYPDSRSITPLGGAEYNFWRAPEAAHAVCERWPGEVVFSGFEVGDPILAGRLLTTRTPPENPVRVAYEVYAHPGGRSAWDETAIWYAVRGAAHGGRVYFREVAGRNVVNPQGGGNAFVPGPGPHRYLEKALPDVAYSEAFDALQIRPPALRR